MYHDAYEYISDRDLCFYIYIYTHTHIYIYIYHNAYEYISDRDLCFKATRMLLSDNNIMHMYISDRDSFELHK